CFRDSLLFVIRIKNRGTVLPTNVISLPIELSGIMRDGEMNFQQLTERRLARVVTDFDSLGMIRFAAADRAIVGGLCRISCVAAAHRDDSTQLLEDSLNAPEAAAGEHGAFFYSRRQQRRIDFRVWKIFDRNSASIHVF